MLDRWARRLPRWPLWLAGGWWLAGCSLATDLDGLAEVSASAGPGGASAAGQGGAGASGSSAGGSGAAGKGNGGAQGGSGGSQGGQSGLGGQSGASGVAQGGASTQGGAAGQAGAAGQGGASGAAPGGAAGQGGAGASGGGVGGQGGAGVSGAGQGGAGGGGTGASGGGQSGAGGAGQAGASGQAGQGGGAGAGASGASGASGGGQSGAGAGGAGAGGEQGGAAGGPDCSKGEVVCDEELGLTCDQATGACVGECAPQSLGQSHVGCDFWATVSSHGSVSYALSFGLVLTNTSDQPAHVRVYRGTKVVAEVDLPGAGTSEVTLPWVDALRNPYDQVGTAEETLEALQSSRLAQASAYHIKATRPLVAWQYSPLKVEIAGDVSGCEAPCLAYSLDASLLLPSHTLGTEYFVASVGTQTFANSGLPEVFQWPGFVAVIATQDGTEISLESTAFARPASGLPDVAPQSVVNFSLDRGDVLQLLSGIASSDQFTGCTTTDPITSCSTPPSFDLTGSRITSNLPVAVLGGHDCARTPSQVPGCDHLEEMLPPVATWGKQAVVAAPQAAADIEQGTGKADAQVLRVISADDDNQITFVPSTIKLGGYKLDRGKYVDVQKITAQDFEVRGTGRLLVVQLMQGGAAVNESDATDPPGDPSMAFATPVEQYRTLYPFAVPTTVPYQFAVVVAQKDDELWLDGAKVEQPASAIAGSTFAVRRIKIGPGPHVLQSGMPSGLLLQGYAPSASYLTAGGRGLKPLP